MVSSSNPRAWRAAPQKEPEREGFSVYSEGPVKGIRCEGRSPDQELAVKLAMTCRDTWGDRWYVIEMRTRKLIADFPAP